MNPPNGGQQLNPPDGGQQSNTLSGDQLSNLLCGDQIPNIHRPSAQLQNSADAQASASCNDWLRSGAVPAASPTAFSRPNSASSSQNQQSARRESDRKRRQPTSALPQTQTSIAFLINALVLQGVPRHNIRAILAFLMNRRTSQAGAVNASTSQSSLMNVSSSSRQQPPFTHQVEIVLYSPKLQVIL